MHPLTHDEFIQIYSTVPRLCVDLIIKYQGGFLLTKRAIDPYKGFWHLPGGTVFYGESLEQTAKRVAKEETGCDVEFIKQLGIIEYVDEDDPEYIKKNRHAVSIVIVVEYISGQLKTDYQADEIKVFASIPDNTIPEQGNFLNLNLDKI